MSATYRKLKIILNTRRPHKSRVLDDETGEEVLFISDVTIHCDTHRSYATITLENIQVSIETEQETEEVEQHAE